MTSIYDAAFAPPDVLPFPVGTSPFRQKGNGYLGDRRFHESVVPGGFDAVVNALPDAALKAFFRQSFKASEWYDAYPGAVLEATAARLRGVQFEEHRRETGLFHAEAASKGIYGALLRVVSNENVALWGPRISSIYFEFGKTETRTLGPRAVSAQRRGVPPELAQWVTFASAGFGEGALRAAGARNVRSVIGEVLPDGRAHGRDLVQIAATITWE